MAVAEAFDFLVLLKGMGDGAWGNVRAVYDREADVLYVNFSDPPEAAVDSEMDDAGVITRYAEDGRVVGYTYLEASQLVANSKPA
jgi:uncharacterized protein YuzE